MKTVFTNRELPHIWAHRSQSNGRGHNFYFDGDTIYSYGSHFPIAKHVTVRGESAVLFTTRTYSVSTSKHLSYTRSAVRHLQVFHVPTLDTSATAYTASLNDYAKRIAALALSAGRSRKYADMRLNALVDLVAEANAFAAFIGRKRTFTVPNLDALREQAKVAAVRERARKAKEAARIERENADAIAEWLTGDRSTMPWSVSRVYLRVVDDGQNVETSKGAIFPIEHAKCGFKFVEACRGNNLPYQRGGETLRLGVYIIDKIDASGNVTAGCHYVEYAEIARIAEALR